jgi:organic radical activating enzyme
MMAAIFDQRVFEASEANAKQQAKAEQLKLPITKIYESIQGEGFWAGTRMTFVRFAGCNVGRPFTPQERQEWLLSQAKATVRQSIALPVLQSYRERCVDWAGNVLACDVNYKYPVRHMTVDEIVAAVPKTSSHVCLTGGEPLQYFLTPLIRKLVECRGQVHIETNGTYSLCGVGDELDLLEQNIWISVSPKSMSLKHLLLQANEIKLLIGSGTQDVEKFIRELVTAKETVEMSKSIFAFPTPLPLIYLQPVNHESSLNQHNIMKCVDLIRQINIPDVDVRLSIQMQKAIGVN